MFRFNRVNSAERLRALFTDTYSKRQLFHPNAPLTSPAVMYSVGAGDREVVPQEPLRSVVRLTCESSAKGGICHVYLVGAVPYTPETCEDVSREHKKACPEVRAVINSLIPEVRGVISSLKLEVVFLGLCPSLSHDLKPDQKIRRILGSLFDQEVITEFRVAYEEAQKYGASVVLGDRPRDITLGRVNPTSLGLRSLLFLTPNKLMNLTDFAMNNGCYKWFGYDVAKVKKIFVDERNRYMSATLLEVAREHNSVVAVVGKCCLPEIQKYWKQLIERSFKALHSLLQA